MEECQFCQKMRRSVLSQKPIIDYFGQHFLNFEVDIEIIILMVLMIHIHLFALKKPYLSKNYKPDINTAQQAIVSAK